LLILPIFIYKYYDINELIALITITLSSDKFTVLHFLQEHKRVLRSFRNITITKDERILIKGREYHLIKKEVTLFDVIYTLTRPSILGKNTLVFRFSVLPKNSGCTISVSTKPEKFENEIDEKKFMEEFSIFQAEVLAVAKPILTMSVPRDKIPEIIELAISRSLGNIILLWFSSKDDKYVRVKVKNGELVEKIGDFEDISTDLVNVIVKQLAET